MPSKKEKLIIANKYRSHTCGDIGVDEIGKKVTLAGWVHVRRDHGGLIFIDLRDKWGMTQLTFSPDNKDVFSEGERLRGEDVIRVKGTVVKRPRGMVNKDLATGRVELRVTEIEVLSTAKTPPFAVARAEEIKEELRLKYRYLDLRHPRMQAILKTRDEFIQHIRRYMHNLHFTEVTTPILANSSPEGARDFLVPSRLYPGQFYALPQAPQQFKQLLMVGGLDRYFQIAPCFRDEDPRADRHAGSFYQLDLEMSFVEQEDVFSVVEPLMVQLTKKFSNKTVLQQPFPRLSWREAMTKYGSDKPDLRYKLYIFDVTAKVKGSGFNVFEQAIEQKQVVHALHVPGGAVLTGGDIGELTAKAKENGVQGLAFILLKNEPQSPIIKYLGEDVTAAVIKTTQATKGDAIFFAAGSLRQVNNALGAVRSQAADNLSLKDDSQAAWAWVTDFPMYEYNETEDKIDFSHNPFSMPQGGMAALKKDDPTEVLGYQYDLVLNGFEISSGAVRNHRPDIMYKAFELAGYTKQDVDRKFGGMIKAFQYGAPPHAGLAPGLDRLLFILLDLPNIRDIYAFPKDSKARDLLMNAPAKVTKRQLAELKLRIDFDD